MVMLTRKRAIFPGDGKRSIDIRVELICRLAEETERVVKIGKSIGKREIGCRMEE
jgi:hypothetical protein